MMGGADGQHKARQPHLVLPLERLEALLRNVQTRLGLRDSAPLLLQAGQSCRLHFHHLLSLHTHTDMLPLIGAF